MGRISCYLLRVHLLRNLCCPFEIGNFDIFSCFYKWMLQHWSCLPPQGCPCFEDTGLGCHHVNACVKYLASANSVQCLLLLLIPYDEDIDIFFFISNIFSSYLAIFTIVMKIRQCCHGLSIEIKWDIFAGTISSVTGGMSRGDTTDLLLQSRVLVVGRWRYACLSVKWVLSGTLAGMRAILRPRCVGLMSNVWDKTGLIKAVRAEYPTMHKF